jgi:hypothetical protein
VKTYNSQKLDGTETEIRVCVRAGVSYVITRQGFKWIALGKEWDSIKDAVAFCRFNGMR